MISKKDIKILRFANTHSATQIFELTNCSKSIVFKSLVKLKKLGFLETKYANIPQIRLTVRIFYLTKKGKFLLKAFKRKVEK